MSEIGGYFGLELAKGSNTYHNTNYIFKSGRSALHCILGFLHPSLVHVPFYTCDGLLESFTAANIPYAFYEINQDLEPIILPELKTGEYFLYINYYDIKRKKVDQLSDLYGNRLIVDCSQAFFMKGNGKSWFFNSCRKFFGVPDGSYLYAPANTQPPPASSRNENYIVDHLIKRFNGHTREGYPLFLENEVLGDAEIKQMSTLSEYLLSNIDFEKAAEKRITNFKYLHKILQRENLMSIDLYKDSIPMCYPLLLSTKPNREVFYSNNMFVPTYWADVLHRNISGFETAKSLTEKLLPLPVDHRYDLESMEALISILHQ